MKAYEDKLAQATLLQNEANTLDKHIESHLMQELGITTEEKQKKKGLQMIRFKDLDRWGVEYQLKEKGLYKNAKYPLKSMSDFIFINPKSTFPKENIEASFIPMECVSDKNGDIIELKNGSTQDSKGYTKFQNNDLIWAKITPCMQNGKSAIVHNLKNGIGYGSTEFHVFRQKENSNLRFFYHLFRTFYLRNMAMSYFTGTAGQQRVPASFFEDLKIPLPPLEIQNKIADQIDAWKKEIKAKKEQADAIKQQAKEIFEKSLFETQ